MGSAQNVKTRYPRSLGAQTLFSSLPAAIIAELESKLFVTRYKAGSLIYRQGERPQGIFLVFAGRIRMSAVALHAKTALLRIAGPGDVLNLAACLADEPHLTNAEATEFSSVGFLPRDEVIIALQRHPALSKAVAQHLAVKCMEQGRELLLLRVPTSSSHRLAATLLRLAESRRDGSDRHADLNYTHAELGQLIGASRETVSRLMKHFESRALIKIDRSRFSITDQDSMKELGGD